MYQSCSFQLCFSLSALDIYYIGKRQSYYFSNPPPIPFQPLQLKSGWVLVLASSLSVTLRARQFICPKMVVEPCERGFPHTSERIRNQQLQVNTAITVAQPIPCAFIIRNVIFLFVLQYQLRCSNRLTSERLIPSEPAGFYAPDSSWSKVNYILYMVNYILYYELHTSSTKQRSVIWQRNRQKYTCRQLQHDAYQ